MKLDVAVFPLLSLAEQVTFVRPSLKRLREGGGHDTGTEPSTSSVAVTVYVTRARLALPGARTTFAIAP
jgi:hypothetical protein